VGKEEDDRVDMVVVVVVLVVMRRRGMRWSSTCMHNFCDSL
jgi:hypothetical protein